MFAKLSEKLSPYLQNAPLCLRSVFPLIANIIDELPILLNMKLKKGWNFIDIGANVGAYSFIAAMMVGKKGTVMSVEPHPRSLESLIINTKLINNIVPMHIAIWNRNERRDFYSADTAALSSLLPSKKRTEIFKIKCLTLDTFYERIIENRLNHFNIDAIKIDVEGAEKEVLEGAEKIISMLKLIIIEIHKPENMKDIVQLLRVNNFQIKIICSNRIIGIRPP